MSSALAERLEIGPTAPRTHPRARRRLLRGVLVFVGALIVLFLVALATSHGYQPPAQQPALDVAPVPAVQPWDRHLPYAFVDRSDTVTSNGLRARVVRPRGAEGTIPGVVLVAGSGATTRDDLADEAEALARGGLAVLSYDKRAEGYSPVSRDYAALADDALAALDTVARQPGVDPDRVGLLGFSEGAWVVPLAAQKSSRVAFTVLVSAPVVSPLDQAAWASDRILAAVPGPARAAAAAGLVMGRPVVDYLGFDVTPALRAMPQPTYAVWGASDRTVPVGVAVERFRSATGTQDPIEIVGGAGHRVSVASGWAERAADWVRRGYPRDPTIRGVRPDSSAGLPTLPAPGPIGDPRLQLGLALLAAAVAACWPTRPRRGGGFRTSRPG